MNRLTVPPRSYAAYVWIIRLLVGWVFVSEGIQKFLYWEARGGGRFERIGIPMPETAAGIVAVLEIVCGALVLAGLLTRIAVLPLIGIMVTALVTTKIPILLGQDMWIFKVRSLSQYGFWSMAHESRTDASMLLGSIFLLLVGGGAYSCDAVLRKKRQPAEKNS